MSPFFKKDSDKKEDEQQAHEWLIPEDTRKQLSKMFEALPNPVSLQVYTQEGHNDVYNEYLVKLVTDVGKISSKIETSFHDLDSDEARKYGVATSPTLLVSPEKYRIRFSGVPLGEEGKSFIESILLASSGESGLSKTSKEALAELQEARDVSVFVTPTCPYCPGQVVNAFRCAVERPDLISAECVEASENPDLTTKYEVGPVPHTVINDSYKGLGLMPEERFVAELITLQTAEEALDQHWAEQDAHGHGQTDVIELDLVIIGAGPAGLAAGIYAVRSGLKSVILEKAVVGGQVALTPVVENYPSFHSVSGKKLMDIMSEHAREYTEIHEGESVAEIKVGRHIEVYTNKAVYLAKALILCTGSTWKKIGAPGEDEFFGHGVNFCASCDGYMYKGKEVAVVGGGNTALTDALHLKNLGADVTIIHRRDAFRAEKHLQDSVEREEIPVIWNHVVSEVRGKDGHASELLLTNTQDGTEQVLGIDGVFVAIGQQPNVDLAEQIGLRKTPDGWLEADRAMRTNIPRIYAAGDVTGGVQQIVTAVGEGTTAALSAFEDIMHPYWKKS